MKTLNKKLMKNGVEMILEALGLDWTNDENLKDTPERVFRAYLEFNKGRIEKPEALKTFPTTYKGIVFINPITAIGLCPHHLLPIYYEITFAYIPKKTAVGLSKIPRIIKHICAQPLIQEELTREIVKYFNRTLHPTGIAIVISGIHGCIKYRGLKENAAVKTSELSGAFYNRTKTRNEFYALINA